MVNGLKSHEICQVEIYLNAHKDGEDCILHCHRFQFYNFNLILEKIVD